MVINNVEIIIDLLMSILFWETITKTLNQTKCLVAWPLNESEACVDLVLIETSLRFFC